MMKMALLSTRMMPGSWAMLNIWRAVMLTSSTLQTPARPHGSVAVVVRGVTGGVQACAMHDACKT
jgi:hypothetical protein